jgi:hypothetical protein
MSMRAAYQAGYLKARTDDPSVRDWITHERIMRYFDEWLHDSYIIGQGNEENADAS